MCNDSGFSRCHSTELYINIEDHQWPIVYANEYNITLCGLEKLQAYDISKWGNVFNILKGAGLCDVDTVVKPREAQFNDLRVVHSKEYLENLKWGSGRLSELPNVTLLPQFLVDSRVLRPLRYQTGGTVLAAKLAIDRGWAINLGGGFHHCCADRGGGYCAYADISLALRFLFNHVPGIERAMVIDLDASQCNGPERDFLGDDRVFIFDMYNRKIYPQDAYAKRGIRHRVEVEPGTEDDEYLQLLRRSLEEALVEFEPDFVLYVAGVSPLCVDVTGGLCLTAEGTIERDQIVVQKVRTRGIPIAMVTGGGYTKSAAIVTAQSIISLYRLGLISGPTQPPPSRLLTCRETIMSASGGGFWSRLRSSSIGNFMPATNNPLLTDCSVADKCLTKQLAHSDSVELNYNPACDTIGRCISMPNMDAGFRDKLFEASDEEDSTCDCDVKEVLAVDNSELSVVQDHNSIVIDP